VKALAEEFSAKKGRRATKREIEVLVRDSRAKNLSEITSRRSTRAFDRLGEGYEDHGRP
jgi:hypothetical protein